MGSLPESRISRGSGAESPADVHSHAAALGRPDGVGRCGSGFADTSRDDRPFGPLPASLSQPKNSAATTRPRLTRGSIP